MMHIYAYYQSIEYYTCFWTTSVFISIIYPPLHIALQKDENYQEATSFKEIEDVWEGETQERKKGGG